MYIRWFDTEVHVCVSTAVETPCRLCYEIAVAKVVSFRLDVLGCVVIAIHLPGKRYYARMLLYSYCSFFFFFLVLWNY